MERWEDHVGKWDGWARARNRNVEFIWWGSSELLELLSGSEHVGRVYFWFGERGFDDAWFEARFDEAIRAAGPRYTPPVHVDLPIALELETFGRTESAINDIKSLARGIRKELQHIGTSGSNKEDPSQEVAVERLSRAAEDILKDLSTLEPTPTGVLPFGDIAQEVASAETVADEIIGALSERARDHDAKRRHEGKPGYYDNPFRRRLHRVYELQSKLRETGVALSHADEFANSNLLIVNGAAGTGKTHLLCDVTQRRLAAKKPTVLLMGQRFVSADVPWSQALQQLDLPRISTAEFVGALEAAAEAAGCRALLIIDAINEGQGRRIWAPNLAAFLAPLERSPWIAVVLSVRSTYEDVVIPEEIRSQAVVVTHHGFAEHEYDATRTFFSYYGLELPSTPILQPEFRNPLFLKTLCKGLSDDGQRRLPRGFHGITASFELYLRVVNKRLAETLGFNPRDELVRKALQSLAEHLVETNKRWVPRDRAEKAVNAQLPGRKFEDSLYRGLVTEGVLIEEIATSGGKHREEFVLISYERFADHLIADLLLRTRLDVNSPEAAFAEGGGLAFVCDKDRHISPGLLEALCIQVPERVGEELIKLAPALVDRSLIRDAFRQSVVWRKLGAFSESTQTVLNEFTQSQHDFDDTVDVLLTVAIVEGHPLNAEFLDARLRRDSMADRDSWWSTYLHRAWGTRGAVDRIVDWASGISPETDLGAQVVDLTSIALAWMLTSSNRFLRDRATKALVSLLTGRFQATSRLVDRFFDVDDPYVTERIFAVAYGQVMRSNDVESVGALAARVYDRVFAGGTPRPHILLRDYARGVIERALRLGAELTVDEQLIRPPYASPWPHIPEEDEIQPLLPDWGHGSQNSGEVDWGWNLIAGSVLDDDFARYVIGTNSSSSNWLSLRLDEEPWQSPRKRMAALLSTLDSSVQLAWKRYREAEQRVRLLVRLAGLREFGSGKRRKQRPPNEEKGVEVGEAEQARETALRDFQATVSAEKWKDVESILRSVNEGDDDRPPRFDLKLIQRYVLWRVSDLGWTSERFGEFDRSEIRSQGREARKAERIGKKYQWIGYHEILAYIADHYQYREWLREEVGDQAYDGTWQESLRDIDPSCTLPSTPGGTSWNGHSRSWWGGPWYSAWDETGSHGDWILRENDIPELSDFLTVVHPEDGSRWVNVLGYFNWRQPHPPDLDSIDVERRDFWVHLTGYFLHARDVRPFMNWAKGVDFWGRWMPDPPEVYGMFLGEYGWSPAFRYFNQPYYGAEQWTNPGNGCPISVRIGSFEYVKESGGFDCSINESYALHLPIYELVDRLGLQWTGRSADYIERNGSVAAFDPTAYEEGPTALLLREDLLKRYLSIEGLALCWTALGEKRVLGGGFGGKYHGALRMSGAYALRDSGPEGFLVTRRDNPKA